MSAYRKQAVRPLTEEEMQEDPDVAKVRLLQQGETIRLRVQTIAVLIGMMTLILSASAGVTWDGHEKTLQKEADARKAQAEEQKAKDEAVKSMFDEMRTQEQLKIDWVLHGCSGRFQDVQQANLVPK